MVGFFTGLSFVIIGLSLVYASVKFNIKSGIGIDKYRMTIVGWVAFACGLYLSYSAISCGFCDIFSK